MLAVWALAIAGRTTGPRREPTVHHVGITNVCAGPGRWDQRAKVDPGGEGPQGGRLTVATGRRGSGRGMCRRSLWTPVGGRFAEV